MQYSFPLSEKAGFYLSYFLHKTFFIWSEVKRPKLKMFLYEMIYSALKIVDYSYQYPSPFGTGRVDTIFGRFAIRPRTSDMANVSPAFERRDIDYMLKLLARLKGQDKRILFLDAGADLGTFTVTVGNALKGYERHQTLCFEPTGSSFALLNENIALNGLGGKARAIKAALWSREGLEIDIAVSRSAPGTSGIRAGAKDGDAHVEKVSTTTIDAAVGDIADEFDVLVIKMDVEGAEAEILKGAGQVLGSSKDIYLLVEDFVKPDIVDFLQSTGWEFVTKLTTYNSWWHRGGGHRPT